MRVEVAAIRRRIHLLRQRWIPCLEEALAALNLALDELEHSDNVRLRLTTTIRPLSPPATARDRD